MPHNASHEALSADQATSARWHTEASHVHRVNSHHPTQHPSSGARSSHVATRWIVFAKSESFFKFKVLGVATQLWSTNMKSTRFYHTHILLARWNSFFIRIHVTNHFYRIILQTQGFGGRNLNLELIYETHAFFSSHVFTWRIIFEESFCKFKVSEVAT